MSRTTLKSPAEIDLMDRANRIVREVLEALRERVRPGMTTAEIDAFAEEQIRRAGAEPAFKGYPHRHDGRDFPAEISGVRLEWKGRTFAQIVIHDISRRKQAEAERERLLEEIATRLQGGKERVAASTQAVLGRDSLRGKTWVTRKGVHVDRMASAWLIRRFIDPEARFKFVPAKGYKPLPNEIRFDMFEAEFTHVGDRCTMEVLIERTAIDDKAARIIAEIVHDIDLKDAKFKHPETSGIERLIAGIAMAHRDDEVRLTRASAVFDDFSEYFSRKAAH